MGADRLFSAFLSSAGYGWGCKRQNLIPGRRMRLHAGAHSRRVIAGFPLKTERVCARRLLLPYAAISNPCCPAPMAGRRRREPTRSEGPAKSRRVSPRSFRRSDLSASNSSFWPTPPNFRSNHRADRIDDLEPGKSRTLLMVFISMDTGGSSAPRTLGDGFGAIQKSRMLYNQRKLDCCSAVLRISRPVT